MKHTSGHRVFFPRELYNSVPFVVVALFGDHWLGCQVDIEATHLQTLHNTNAHANDTSRQEDKVAEEANNRVSNKTPEDKGEEEPNDLYE